MRLLDVLPLYLRDVVAFVGAGGKSRSMFRLAEELAWEGWRVVSTATTSMSSEDLQRVPQRVGLGHGMRLPPSISTQLDRHRHVFVFTRIDRSGQVRGVRPLWLDANLATFDYHDILLVEADGSRRLPLKAPKPDEPTIPTTATVVVPVVGLDALGQPLEEDSVYGAGYIHQWLGHPLGAPITPEALAATLLHPALGKKRIEAEVRTIPLLNKVTPERLTPAREVARRLLQDYTIERVIIGAVQDEDPVWEVHRRVGALVLAAGHSTRMGRPKMLLPWAGGTVIRHVVQKVTAANLADCVVVGGELTPDLRREIRGLPAHMVRTDGGGEMIDSVRAALDVLWYTCDAVLIVLGDQPMVETNTVRRLMAAYAAGRGRIIIPSYDDQRGHPILMDRSVWEQIFDLPPDGTLRDVIDANSDAIHHVTVSTPGVLWDIDTPDEYDAARRTFDPD